MKIHSRSIWLGFLSAAMVLLMLLWFIGIGEISAAFAKLTTRSVAVIFGLALAWMLSWSLALHRILNVVGAKSSVWVAFLLFASSVFADNITLFGQAGGGPFSALLISNSTKTTYETGLASITSFDALNLLPSITLAVIGLSYYAVQYAVGQHLSLIMILIAGTIVCLPIVSYTSWRYSTQINSKLTHLLTVILQYSTIFIPSYEPPGQDAIRERVDGYFQTIHRISTNPTDLFAASMYLTIGWVLMGLIMFVSIQTLLGSVNFPLFVVFIIVPVATIASVTPLPGGTGGVEVAITLLLLPMGISKEVALGAALIYRLGTYWFSTLLGGICVLILEQTTN
ncbi:YbhN family protein [Haladaptatus sp. CMAA 1911]|uniref:lysylphosphatidylglycerol synthase transmembrane domain-containing protein n=1 Tax=unclassified Haladaptatus TaxID=2622732 RepID=UPI0037547CF4